jgi:hypothetical protein
MDPYKSNRRSIKKTVTRNKPRPKSSLKKQTYFTRYTRSLFDEPVDLEPISR